MSLAGHLISQMERNGGGNHGNNGGQQQIRFPQTPNKYDDNHPYSPRNLSYQTYTAPPPPPVMTGYNTQWGSHHGSPGPSGWGGSGGGNGLPSSPWSEERIAMLQARLQRKLGPEYVDWRSSGGGQVSYIAGWKAINLANEVFGFNGWSSHIVNMTTDYVDDLKDGRYQVGVTCIVRVTLADGAYHEDVGFGNTENQKFKSMAIENAKKEAVTDGMKRAIRNFGNVLGNCLYDNEYTKQVKSIRVPPVKLDPNNLERRAEFTPPPQPGAGPSRAASAIPSHISGMPKPPAPPQWNGNAADARPVQPEPEPPLRSIDDEFDETYDSMMLDDESMLVEGPEPVTAAPPRPQSAAAPTGPAYQHRARPDMPAAARPRAPSEPSPPPGEGNTGPPVRRQVGGLAAPGGDSAAATEAARQRRLAAIMGGAGGGDGGGGGAGSSRGPCPPAALNSAGGAGGPVDRIQSPPIPTGGVDAVAARAGPNLSLHGANLEIENQTLDTPTRYAAFASARGVKREGDKDVSPSKNRLHAINNAIRSPLPELSTDQGKRPRVS